MRVAVLVDNTLEHDRRALLELKTIQELQIDLTVYCNKLDGKPDEDFQNGIKIKRIFTPSHWQWKQQHKLKELANGLVKEKFDVLHCHDHFMLYVGALVKEQLPKTILIYESRELFYSYPINYFEENFFTALKSRFVRWLQVMRERKNIQKADHLIVVNESIADFFVNQFSLIKKPIVVRNIGPLRVPDENDLLRNELGISPHKKIIAYIGINVYPNVLKLEQLIDEIRNHDVYVLVIIANNNARREYFEDYVRERKQTNVYFHQPVPVDQIESYLAGCDVGVLTAWNKKNLSYWHALDNKLFSYIMAGIPVLSTAQPEYQKIVEQYKVGVCVNPENKNAFINGLVEIAKNENQFKQNAAKARIELNWKNEKNGLVELYRKLRNQA